jgi:Arc/MetJ family transcription regulator
VFRSCLFPAMDMNLDILQTSWPVRSPMRTNIEIDDRLMREAMRRAKTKTKRATVEQGLRALIRMKRQEGIRRFRGKVRWEGKLEDSRRN